MKKNRELFTEEEIKKLKLHHNLVEIARDFGLSTKSNTAYKVLRKFPKNKYSNSAKYVAHLQELLQKIENK